MHPIYHLLISLKNTQMPKNIPYMFNFGFLLITVFIIQFVTGLLMSFFYINSTSMAFSSITLMGMNSNFGWINHAFHANFVSVFFLFLYMHIYRNISLDSMKYFKVWSSGFLIYMLLMVISFLGYVLVWGQMSLWGATVITNLLTIIPMGDKIMFWLWGDFSLSNNLLKFFFSLHFLLPFVLLVLVAAHIVLLHEKGSTDMLSNFHLNKLKFDLFFFVKDLFSLFSIFLILMVIFFNPFITLDSENFIKANVLLSPVHIQPEWYFLYIYAVLRSIPNKLGGLVMALVIIVLLYLLCLGNFLYSKKKFAVKIFLDSTLVMLLLLLTWLGSKPVEYPYNMLGLYLSVALLVTMFSIILTSFLPYCLF